MSQHTPHGTAHTEISSHLGLSGLSPPFTPTPGNSRSGIGCVDVAAFRAFRHASAVCTCIDTSRDSETRPTEGGVAQVRLQPGYEGVVGRLVGIPGGSAPVPVSGVLLPARAGSGKSPGERRDTVRYYTVLV